MAGFLVSIPAICFANMIPSSGVEGTKPRDFGPQARAVIAEIYPEWSGRDRNLLSDELEYSSMVIESLCEVNEALDAEMMGGRSEMQAIARSLSGMGYKTATVIAITQCERCAIGHHIYLDGKPLEPGISWPSLELREKTDDGRVVMVEMPLPKALIRTARLMRDRMGQGWRRTPYALKYRVEFETEDLLG
jgi:hypothetical protein